MASQSVQQIEFLGPDLQLLASDLDFTPKWIDPQVRYLEGFTLLILILAGFPTSPEDCLDPGNQFPRVKWLREIIIRS